MFVFLFVVFCLVGVCVGFSFVVFVFVYVF